MLLQINENLWVNVDQIELLRMECNGSDLPGYFKLNNSHELYPLSSLEYQYLVAALKMFSSRNIVKGE
jgi:hypothetical protein